MSPPSHQTVRLRRGKHLSPTHGACVMELASMLAGESFTDRPRSACPVIASLLRSYNDAIDDERRQDLYEYASRVVGSRGSHDVQRARAGRVHAWTQQRRARPRRAMLRLLLGGLALEPPDDVVGIVAIRSLRTLDDRTHAAVLSLVDELLAMGTAGRPAASVERAGPGPGPARSDARAVAAGQGVSR